MKNTTICTGCSDKAAFYERNGIQISNILCGDNRCANFIGFGRGGARPGAGRKAGWETGPADKVIRIPAKLADQVLDLARELDAGRPVLDTCDSNNAIIRDVLALLQVEAERLADDRKAQPRRSTVNDALRLLEQYQLR